MPSTTCETDTAEHRDEVLALADDALIASHRLSEWVARSPELEEDVALANIALDLLGQARLLLTYAGELSDPPLSEDDLAYVRPATAFHNATLLERPQPDFAVAIVRVLLLAAYQHARYTALLDSPDQRLAAIAAKAVKEVAYHRDHGRLWTLRLGDGTGESHRRMQDALDAEWPWFCALLEGSGVVAETLAYLEGVLDEATLGRPFDAVAEPSGREGRHTEHLAEILAQMREVTAAHPGATW
ncbi:MAG: 1,2-phenylacetyl-CoA epoxidase subunit PaaC [Marmoricola sp.]